MHQPSGPVPSAPLSAAQGLPRPQPAPLSPRDWLLFTLLGAALTLTFSWPQLTRLSTHLADRLLEPDLQVGLWWPGAAFQRILAGQNPFFTPLLGYPAGMDLTQLLWNVGPAILFGPLFLAFGPVLGLNLSTLLINLLNALACVRLVSLRHGSRLACGAALVVGATAVYTFQEGNLGRPEQALWAPVALCLGHLLTLWEHPDRRRHALLAGLWLGLTGATYWFYAYFLIVIGILAVAGLALTRRLEAPFLRALALTLACSALVALPFLLPILLSLLQNPHTFQQVVGQALPSRHQQLLGSLSLLQWAGPFGPPPRAMPALLLPMSLLALWRGKGQTRALGLLGLGCLVLSLGPLLCLTPHRPYELLGRNLLLPMALLDMLPGWSRLWWPYRWLGVAIPTLALLVGLSLDGLRRPRLALAALLAISLLQADWFTRTRTNGLELDIPLHLPAALAAIAQAPFPSPCLLVPEHRLLQGMTVYQPWLKQPISTGIGWHMRGVRPTLPGQPHTFQQQVEAAARGARLPPLEPTQARDFAFVLFIRDPLTADRLQLERLEGLLGRPFYLDTQLVAWAVPGKGMIPQGFSHLPSDWLPRFTPRHPGPPLPPPARP